MIQTELLDITGAEFVEVQLDQKGRTLWVHVGGRTVLRICQIENFHFEDFRSNLIRQIQEKDWEEIAKQER